MSDGMNKVILLGNLGADPELRFTKEGQAVLNLRMACTETWFDKDKVKQERTEWASVVVWGKRGEGLAKILKKGDKILVEGGLRTSSYDDKEGNKRYKTEVNALDVFLCGGGGKGQSAEPREERQPQASNGRPAASRGPQRAPAWNPEEADSDIPF